MYQVFPRKSAASGGFWFFLLLSPFFGVLLLMGMLHFGRAAIEGDLKNLALGLAMVAMFGWLAAALWRYWWQFYQIRCLAVVSQDVVQLAEPFGWRLSRESIVRSVGVVPVEISHEVAISAVG